jgi:excisionase family DNA binding protein
MTRLEAALAELAAAIREEVAVARQADGAPPALLSIEEAARRLGIGRSTVYEALGHGELRSVRVRGRRLVPIDAIAELIKKE